MGSIANSAAGATLTLFAFVIAGAGAYLNFHGASYMVPGAAGQVVASAAVIAEFVKLFWLTGLSVAVASRNYGAAIGVIVLGVALHAFSLVCAIGVTASERATVMDIRGDQQESKKRAEAALTEAQARVEALAAKASNVKAELALTKQLDQARQDVKEARARLDALKAPGARDPQSEALAAYLPVSVDQLSKALPLLPSLIVEFGPTLTLLLASVFFGVRRREEVAVKTGTAAVSVSYTPEDDREAAALTKATALVLAAEGALETSHRQLAAALAAPKTTVGDWLKRWQDAGHLQVRADGLKTTLLLPAQD
jgi:hypothetical protein